ncbi:3843_t:CDS:2 [Paraglomus brasilianum]|uniref:3843_t:CDS:1 n=1 Tax=Paraglomus brasilianum TaxID=144538 RepID=A0A9N8WP44_9GLOM|nr:3843_t:CDS:2 [Paraglomus brasilianum]
MVSSAFKEVTVEYYIHLAPVFFGNVTHGIKEIFGALVMKYVPELGGIVLAFSNLRVLSPGQYILEDTPYGHFWVRANLLLWAPEIGCISSATVTMQSAGHIRLRMYDTFDVIIPVKEIPRDVYGWTDSEAIHQLLRTDTNSLQPVELSNLGQGVWFNKSTGDCIETGSELEFKVIKMKFEIKGDAEETVIIGSLDTGGREMQSDPGSMSASNE